MKRIWILFFLLFINCLFESCGGSSSPRCFDLVLNHVDNYSYLDFQRMDNGDTSLVENYVILLEGSNTRSICRAGFSVGASLMAETPVYILPNNIVDLSIKSNAALNDELPSGAELKDWFELVLINEDCNPSQPADLNCIENLSDGWPDDDLRQVVNETATYGGLFDEDLPSTILFGLDLALDLLSEEHIHVFTLRFEFKDGTIQEFNTPSVLLKGP